MEYKGYLIALVFMAVVSHAKVSYSGYQVVRVDKIPTQVGAMQLQKLIDNDSASNFDIWKGQIAVGHSADVMVSPRRFPMFERLLKRIQATYQVMINDVEDAIEAQKARPSVKTNQKPLYRLTFDAYHRLDVFYEYLDYLEATFPFVTTEVIGKSYEGRDMRVAKVCQPNGVCGSKPGLWLDGGIHAREWISPATNLYILSELVENEAAHPELTRDFDWFILPSHNPDGYEYTWDEDRMWRKTRSNYGTACTGVDPNRNWDHHWSEASGSSPCAENYHGPSAMSEIEVSNVGNFIRAQPFIVYTVNIHSYGQMVLLPFGYDFGAYAPTYAELDALANRAAVNLTAVHGTRFDIDHIPELVNPASGGSCDYIYDTCGVPCTYGMELRDEGQYGFLLPPEQIIPVGEEIFAYHKEIAYAIKEGFCADQDPGTPYPGETVP